MAWLSRSIEVGRRPVLAIVDSELLPWTRVIVELRKANRRLTQPRPGGTALCTSPGDTTAKAPAARAADAEQAARAPSCAGEAREIALTAKQIGAAGNERGFQAEVPAA